MDSCMKILIITLCSLLVTACKVSNSDRQKTAEKTVKPYTEGIRIAWDYSTLTRVYDGTVFYPRMIRLQNDELLCAFESEGAIHISRSHDEGKSWSDGMMVAPANGEIKAAVPELLQLNNGHILLAYNTRPPQDNADPDRRFGIKLRISNDGGRTWSSQQNIFEGGYEWHRGVWEPAMIQLTTEEIQLFFANEYPYADTHDQEISMVRSSDHGRSWSEPETISYRTGYRDGMPVPLVLENEQGIAVAIEDNGVDSGEFKPAIIWSSAEDNWEQGTADAESDRRWRALEKENQLADSQYGGAPYLRQLSGGETVLSFQSTENRIGDWSKSTMTVAIGDDKVQNFFRKSEPFEVPEGKSALWNSLFIKNDTTVTAVTSTTAYNDRRELYTKDGYIIEELRPTYGSIEVDGNSDEEVWSRSSTIFIGAYNPANTIISTAWDEDNCYVFLSVHDDSQKQSEDLSIEETDGVTIFLAPDLLSDDDIVSGTYKMVVSREGQTAAFQGRNGSWTPHQINVDVASSGTSSGYQLEMGIPWPAIGGRPDEEEGWGINFGLRNRDGIGQVYEETISGNKINKPSTWSRIELFR